MAKSNTNKNNWNTMSYSEKAPPFKAVIQAMRRGKSQPGDGGLLDRNTEDSNPNDNVFTPITLDSETAWHPQDPTFGALQWKGTGGPMPKDANGNTYTVEEAKFRNQYDNIKESYGGVSYNKYNTTDRYLFWDTPGGHWGTIAQRYRAIWIEKVYIPKAGGGTPYKHAKRRSQGYADF